MEDAGRWWVWGMCGCQGQVLCFTLCSRHSWLRWYLVSQLSWRSEYNFPEPPIPESVQIHCPQKIAIIPRNKPSSGFVFPLFCCLCCVPCQPRHKTQSFHWFLHTHKYTYTHLFISCKNLTMKIKKSLHFRTNSFYWEF